MSGVVWLWRVLLSLDHHTLSKRFDSLLFCGHGGSTRCLCKAPLVVGFLLGGNWSGSGAYC